MATKSELIINVIQQYWPEMPISQHLLDNPTSEFVVQFYQCFQDSMKEIIRKMHNIEPASVEEPKPSGDPIISILCFANKHLKLCTSNQPGVEGPSLTLTDLYEPTAKRTQIRFKLLLNIMLYYEERVPSMQEVIARQLEKGEAVIKMKQEKEAKKEKIAKAAEAVACAEDLLNKAQKEEEKANLRYKNLEKQKSEKHLYQQKIRQDLQQLADTYSHKQTLTTNKKANIQHLSKQVVTEASYQALLDLKENLVGKLSDFESEVECVLTNLEQRKPELDHFKNIIQILKSLIIDSEAVSMLQNTISSTATEFQTFLESYKQATKELKASTENIIKDKENTKVINKAIQEMTLKMNAFRENIKQQLEEVKLEINMEEQVQIETAHEKEQLQAKIEEKNNEIEEIGLKINELNETSADIYKSMLERDNATTVAFSTMLENISKPLLTAR